MTSRLPQHMRRVLSGAAAAGGVGAAIFFSSNYDTPSLFQFGNPSFLQTGKQVRCELQSREVLGGDMELLRFRLPSEKHVLGAGPTEHLLAITDAVIYRPYSPITIDSETKGHFDMLVKAYKDGAVSSNLHSLGVGQSFMFAGPLKGSFSLPEPAEPRLNEIRMVAGGTGVAPMYRIIRSVLSDAAHQSTALTLVYASPLDPPPLHKELEALQQAHPDRFKLSYVLSTAPPSDPIVNITPIENPAPTRHYGRIDEKVVRDSWEKPAGALSPLLISGPPGLLEMLCGKGSHDGPDRAQPPLDGLLKRLGYTDREVVRM